MQANTAVFEACSKERIQPFDDDEEDIWEEKEINFATQTKSRNRSHTQHYVLELFVSAFWLKLHSVCELIVLAQSDTVKCLVLFKVWWVAIIPEPSSQ